MHRKIMNYENVAVTGKGVFIAVMFGYKVRTSWHF